MSAGTFLAGLRYSKNVFFSPEVVVLRGFNFFILFHNLHLKSAMLTGTKNNNTDGICFHLIFYTNNQHTLKKYSKHDTTYCTSTCTINIYKKEIIYTAKDREKRIANPLANNCHVQSTIIYTVSLYRWPAVHYK